MYQKISESLPSNPRNSNRLSNICRTKITHNIQMLYFPNMHVHVDLNILEQKNTKQQKIQKKGSNIFGISSTNNSLAPQTF